jgi:antitoxin YefM
MQSIFGDIIISSTIAARSIVKNADFTIIIRRDAPDAVVMSMDTFNSLMETVHLLKTPANAQHLARSIEQYRQCKTVDRNLVW